MPMLFERASASLSQAVTLVAWSLPPSRTNPFNRTDSRTKGWAGFGRAHALRRPAIALAAIASAPALILMALLSTQAVTAWAYPEGHWRQRLTAVIRPADFDSTGQILGFLPPPGASDLESAYAADPGEIAPSCIDMVLAREDGHHDQPWRHIRGVDLGSAVGALFRSGGASTLTMQLGRQLSPDWSKSHSRWQRKVLEAGSAAALIDAHDGDYRRLAASYLAVAPFGIAYGDLRGIAAAADVMWGVVPAKLSSAQCALLVVLLPKRLNLSSTDAGALQAAWRERLVQARQLLQSQPGRWGEAAMRELDSWPSVPMRPPLLGLGEAPRLNLGSRTRALVLPQLARIDADQPALSRAIASSTVTASIAAPVQE